MIDLKNFIKIIPTILIVISFKCFSQNEVEFVLSDFRKTIELKGEALKFVDPFLDPSRILLQDSLLFVSNSNVTPSVDVFSINTGKRIARFCKRGRGPGELVFPFSTQIVDLNNEFMVHDLNGKKIVLYSLDLILSDNDKKFTEIINVSDIYPRKIVQINSNRYFCGLIGHEDGFMNCIIDSTGSVVKFLNKFPDVGLQYNTTIASNIFSTNIGISDNNENIIVPYNYWDRIDLFQNNGDFRLILKGPNYKKLDVIKKNGRVVKTSNNNRSYNYPVANDKFFIIPYSGKKRDHRGPSYTNLFQFDFKGSPLVHYTLDVPIFDIAVDWGNRIIYGLNIESEPILYKFSF
ncbi:BF3164 family lipoprotein [Draconibacterium halophilum]|uniref:6-bladed beta-propeller n=1 Tax=Draconibacterium halophilum TaxID=2706887 RepID=A0A6C0R9E3_9BACT|nr:BF3164 family lipoprotein [Draconibacterium halophilum]QIA06562.1 6-bladed beta-propeller [Draconibacterium halophilum]